MVQLGPIISVLEEDVKQELRQKGIVIWLDKDAHYKGYVDELVKRYERGEFPFPVVPFRDSYLEMLLALEPYGNGKYPDRLLLHMPGHTEESIRKSPILELYHAGARYRRALDTLIWEAATGRMSPDQIDSYLSNNVSNIAAAEQWLEKALAQPQDDCTRLKVVRLYPNKESNSTLLFLDEVLREFPWQKWEALGASTPTSEQVRSNYALSKERIRNADYLQDIGKPRRVLSL